MFFLIRMAFWFSLVLLALPFGSGSKTPGGEGIGPLQALVAAKEAIGDVAGLCERKPDVCAAGQSAMSTIGVRAKESARIAYEALGEVEGLADASETTGGIAP